MATQPLFGDPAAKAPVWSKYAVLLGSLTATVPSGNAAFTLNNTTRTESVTTTSASAVIVGTTFTAADVGLAITGTGIPAATTIASVESATSATMSAAASASGTVTATIGTAVTTEWDPVGALDSDSPFDDGAESISSSDHSAAGHGVYATTYKDQKETRTFTAKESTLVTLGLIYDASGVTDTAGELAGTLKRRDPTETFLIAFHRENATKVERYISVNYAYIDSISRSFGNDESMRTVAVVIAPNSDDELYTYFLGDKA